MATRPERRPGRDVFFLCVICFFVVGCFPLAGAAQDTSGHDLIQPGVTARGQGNIQLSIDLLATACKTADSERERVRASAELGASLLQARRLDDAESFLQHAYSGSSGVSKARVAVELGNLALSRSNTERARDYYEEAQSLAGENLGLRLPASINRARLVPRADRLAVLADLFAQIGGIAEPKQKARLYLNLGFQARQLEPEGLELAYRSFAQARKLLPQLDLRLALETLDALAQLYEDQQRRPEALQLTRAALERAPAGAARGDEDILLRLEWRRGRLLKLDGRGPDALLAYRSAAAHLAAIRLDIPIEYEDGRSSFRHTLQPIYSGVVDLTLSGLDQLPAPARASSLRAAIQAIELTRQSEMQDFLGDRCSVDGVLSDAPRAIPANTAAIYPVLLPDRLELLLESDGAIVRRTVKVGSAQIEQRVRELAKALARYESSDYLPAAQQLYDWLLRPFETEFTARDIHTVVVVSDGPLRLIPIAALHDGSRFAIERFAISTVTGLSMTSVQVPSSKRGEILLAGLSAPGSVIDKLPAENIDSILVGVTDARAAPASRVDAPKVRSARLRSARLRASEGGAALSRDPAARAAQLKASLAIPGVTEEIQTLQAMMPGVAIVDEAFTLERFTQEMASGDYRMLHIASHGVFGGSASDSYIMTYDELLTMDGLAALLNDKQGNSTPIELLTLSACETAEGNDRSPLGISGAAIKAKARSVIGTLWPVGDQAARKIMDKFYAEFVLGNHSKSQALQRAQKKLIARGKLAHPFYWAPFVLIGNWQ